MLARFLCLALVAGLGAAHVASAAGAAIVQVTADGTSSVRPAWSPDGHRIAFQSSTKGVYRVYTMAADGSDRQTASQGDVDDRHPAWSPDSKTMYFSDSHAGAVWAYDFDPATGGIANRRTFIDMTASGGVADGATVDAEGCYWLTIPVTSKVCRYDPDGRLIETVVLPTDLPTCCEFGGKDLDVLYVTTAVLRRPAAHFAGQTAPGGLFALDVGVKGLTLPPYAG